MSESFYSPALWAHTETTAVVLVAIVLVGAAVAAGLFLYRRMRPPG